MKSSKYIRRWKSCFTDFVQEMLKEMSALNNLRKKETFLTLGEDELLAEMVRNYPFFYDKTWTQGTKKQVIETQKRNNSIVADNTF